MQVRDLPSFLKGMRITARGTAKLRELQKQKAKEGLRITNTPLYLVLNSASRITFQQLRYPRKSEVVSLAKVGQSRYSAEFLSKIYDRAEASGYIES